MVMSWVEAGGSCIGAVVVLVEEEEVELGEGQHHGVDDW